MNEKVHSELTSTLKLQGKLQIKLLLKKRFPCTSKNNTGSKVNEHGKCETVTTHNAWNVHADIHRNTSLHKAGRGNTNNSRENEAHMKKNPCFSKASRVRG